MVRLVRNEKKKHQHTTINKAKRAFQRVGYICGYL